MYGRKGDIMINYGYVLETVNICPEFVIFKITIKEQDSLTPTDIFEITDIGIIDLTVNEQLEYWANDLILLAEGNNAKKINKEIDEKINVAIDRALNEAIWIFSSRKKRK